MTPEGYYYLHANGDLIYKPHDAGRIGDFMESDLVRTYWPLDSTDRANGWAIVVEAWAAGANPVRVNELVEQWGCTDDDAQQYADRIGVVLGMDGNAYFARCQDFENLQESPAGFGPRAVEALAELAAALGYRPTKPPGPGLAQLVAR